MVLANLAEYVDTDQGPIAGYLTVAVSAFLELDDTAASDRPFHAVLLLAAHCGRVHRRPCRRAEGLVVRRDWAPQKEVPSAVFIKLSPHIHTRNRTF